MEHRKMTLEELKILEKSSGQSRTLGIVIAVLCIPFILGAGYLFFSTDWVMGGLLLGLGFLLGIPGVNLFVNFMKCRQDISAGVVDIVQGTITGKRQIHYKAMTSHFILVDKKEWPVSKEVHDRLKEGDLLSMAFAPRSRVLFSLTPF